MPARERILLAVALAGAAVLTIVGVVGTALGVAGLSMLVLHAGATVRYWLESLVALAVGLAALSVGGTSLVRLLRRAVRRTR